jgi:hypothetical protein
MKFTYIVCGYVAEVFDENKAQDAEMSVTLFLKLLHVYYIEMIVPDQLFS